MKHNLPVRCRSRAERIGWSGAGRLASRAGDMVVWVYRDAGQRQIRSPSRNSWRGLRTDPDPLWRSRALGLPRAVLRQGLTRAPDGRQGCGCGSAGVRQPTQAGATAVLQRVQEQQGASAYIVWRGEGPESTFFAMLVIHTHWECFTVELAWDPAGEVPLERRLVRVAFPLDRTREAVSPVAPVGPTAIRLLVGTCPEINAGGCSRFASSSG